MILVILLATIGQGWAWADKPAAPAVPAVARPSDSPLVGKCGLTLCTCCEKSDALEAARRDDMVLIQHQAAKIVDARKAAEKAEAPKAEPPAVRVWVSNQGRYGWGRIEAGYFVAAPGDDPGLYDSGPFPKLMPPAPAIPAPVQASRPSCYTDSRGRRVCPR